MEYIQESTLRIHGVGDGIMLSQWLNKIVSETILENFPSLDKETNT